MRAVDTNVLIYAEMVASRHHAVARRLVQDLAEGSRPWAIPWPCVYEFLRVATHARVYYPPAPLEIALGISVASWPRRPSCCLPRPTGTRRSWGPC